MSLFSGMALYSQENKTSATDSSITFKVFGACEQCKHRIEEAVKGKKELNQPFGMQIQNRFLLFTMSRTVGKKCPMDFYVGGENRTIIRKM